MAKPELLRAKSGVLTARPRDRAPLDERSETPRVAPARNIPTELAALLGEIERLNAELRA